MQHAIGILLFLILIAVLFMSRAGRITLLLTGAVLVGAFLFFGNA